MGLKYEERARQIRDELSQLVLFGPPAVVSGPPRLAEAFSERTQPAIDLSRNIIGVGISISKFSSHVELRTIEELSEEQQGFLCTQYPDVPSDLFRFKKVGEIIAQQAQQPEAKNRPAPGGVSISHCKVNGFGTLGCWVNDDSGKQYILSNNHVLTHYINHARTTDEILQPGLRDRPRGKQRGDEIAHFSRCIDIQFDDNKVDVAIAEVINPKDVDPKIMRIGRIQGIRQKGYDLLGLKVQKFGRKTNLTTGTVTAIDLTIKVKYDDRKAIFIDQIEIFGEEQPFSEKGDSGSLILDKDNKAVGLLFAGTIFGATYANTIENVITKLGVTLI